MGSQPHPCSQRTPHGVWLTASCSVLGHMYHPPLSAGDSMGAGRSHLHKLWCGQDHLGSVGAPQVIPHAQFSHIPSPGTPSHSFSPFQGWHIQGDTRLSETRAGCTAVQTHSPGARLQGCGGSSLPREITVSGGAEPGLEPRSPDSELSVHLWRGVDGGWEDLSAGMWASQTLCLRPSHTPETFLVWPSPPRVCLITLVMLVVSTSKKVGAYHAPGTVS